MQRQIARGQEQIDDEKYKKPEIEDLIEELPSIEKTVLLKRDVYKRFLEVFLGDDERKGRLFKIIEQLEGMETEIESDFKEWVKSESGVEHSPAYSRIKYLYEVAMRDTVMLKAVITDKLIPIEHEFKELFNRWESDAEQIASVFNRMKAQRDMYKKQVESGDFLKELNEILDKHRR